MADYPTFPESLPAPLISSLRKEISPFKVEQKAESGWRKYWLTEVEEGKYVDVTWIFSDDQFQQFLQFFEEDLEGGCLPFDLGAPSTDIEYYVQFTEDLFSVTRQDDGLVQVQAHFQIVKGLPSFSLDECGYSFQNYPGAADNFECYCLGPVPTPMPNYGDGWDEVWIVTDLAPSVFDAIDDFESYSLGEAGILDKGVNWKSNWILTDLTPIVEDAIDDFETYALGEVGVLDGGSNWEQAWVITDLEE